MKGRTPRQAIEQKELPSKYSFHERDIALINTKMQKIKHLLPLNTRVRLKSKQEDFYKKSMINPWSKEVYLICGYKRPIFANTPPGLYLINEKTRMKMAGVFYRHELKEI